MIENRRAPAAPSAPAMSAAARRTDIRYAAKSHYGLVAPAGTPQDVVAKLDGALNNALADDEVKSRLAADGTETLPGTPAATIGTTIGLANEIQYAVNQKLRASYSDKQITPKIQLSLIDMVVHNLTNPYTYRCCWQKHECIQ
jgi:Tripartite tricarboxylate transporter family receptor